MMRWIKIALMVLAAVVLQMTLLPAYLKDPFQPNLIMIMVVYMGLKLPHRLFGVAAFGLGVIQDSFSGIYLGLHGFSYLCIYTLLSGIADRLFTNNRVLFVLVVFIATAGAAVLNLLMLFIFSVAKGVYASVFPALIPQALVNALVASLFLGRQSLETEEAR